MLTPTRPDRRHFLNVCTAFGLGSTLMPGVLWGMVQNPAAKKEDLPRITKEMIDEAALIAGVDIKDEYRDMMVGDLNDQLKSYKAIYDMKIPNSVAPAVSFNPVLPGIKIDSDATMPAAPAPAPVRVSKL